MRVESAEEDGDERRQLVEDEQRDEDAVGKAGIPAARGVVPGAEAAGDGVQVFAEGLGDEDEGEAAGNLHEGEQGGAVGFVGEGQRLVDGKFDGGRFRAAAEDEDGAEAGEAEHVDERGDGRQLAAQPRPFEVAKERPAAHAELGGELALFAGDLFEGVEQEAGGERQGEELVDEEDAGEAIGAETPVAAERLPDVRQPALFAVHAEDAGDGDQRRQGEGHGGEAQEQVATGEVAALERAGEEDGGGNGECGRKGRLPEGEAQYVPEVGVGEALCGHVPALQEEGEQGGKADGDEKCGGEEAGSKPGGDAGGRGRVIHTPERSSCM